jgi:hypothetical protein
MGAAYGRAIWPAATVEHKVVLPQHVHEGAARQGALSRKNEHLAAAKLKAEKTVSVRKIG